MKRVIIKKGFIGKKIVEEAGVAKQDAEYLKH